MVESRLSALLPSYIPDELLQGSGSLEKWTQMVIHEHCFLNCASPVRVSKTRLPTYTYLPPTLPSYLPTYLPPVLASLSSAETSQFQWWAKLSLSPAHGGKPNPKKLWALEGVTLASLGRLTVTNVTTWLCLGEGRHSRVRHVQVAEAVLPLLRGVQIRRANVVRRQGFHSGQLHRSVRGGRLRPCASGTGLLRNY